MGPWRANRADSPPSHGPNAPQGPPRRVIPETPRPADQRRCADGARRSWSPPAADRNDALIRRPSER